MKNNKIKHCCRNCDLDECYYYITDCDYCEKCTKEIDYRYRWFIELIRKAVKKQ